MTRRYRRIIFCCLVISFLVVTPFVLIYAQGYSYDWAEHRFIKTGAFYFKSNPEKAEVLIDGEVRGQTNFLIKKMTPGFHKITITFPGYHPWTKTLFVQPNQITQAKNIVLFPKNPELEKKAQWTFGLEEFFKSTEQIIDEQRAADLMSENPNILAWQVCQGALLYLESPSLILYRADLINGQTKQQVSLQPLPAQKETSQKYQITCANNEKISVLDPSGKLFLFNSQEKFFEEISDKAKGVHFCPDQEKIVYWTETEVWVILPKKEKPEKILITRVSQPIQNVAWYSQDNEHIIFAVGDKIKIAELDNRDFINIVDFAEMKNPEIFYSDKDKALYILSEGTIYKTEI